MKLLRAILAGALIWALIFVEWSIIIFAPILKDLGNWQWLIHYLILIPIVIFGTSIYYGSKDKTNGIVLGLIMLATGIVLDAIITVPFFILPQGMSYAEFFINPLLFIGFAEFLGVTWLYWKKKVI